MNTDRSWLLKMAELEDGQIVSVGGLISDMETLELKFSAVTDERSRAYIFPNGERLTVERVVKICVRPSGSHRLELADGKKMIVSPGWLAIEVEADHWSL